MIIMNAFREYSAYLGTFETFFFLFFCFVFFFLVEEVRFSTRMNVPRARDEYRTRIRERDDEVDFVDKKVIAWELFNLVFFLFRFSRQHNARDQLFRNSKAPFNSVYRRGSSPILSNDR